MSTNQQQVGLETLDIVTLVVDDLDEALTFYTEQLGFEKRSDDAFELGAETGRWVTVGLPDDDLRIAFTTPAASYHDDETRAELESRLGTATLWTFRTQDCESTVAALEADGVEITGDPVTQAWGTEATFADPFGNEFGVFEQAG